MNTLETAIEFTVSSLEPLMIITTSLWLKTQGFVLFSRLHDFATTTLCWTYTIDCNIYSWTYKCDWHDCGGSQSRQILLLLNVLTGGCHCDTFACVHHCTLFLFSHRLPYFPPPPFMIPFFSESPICFILLQMSFICIISGTVLWKWQSFSTCKEAVLQGLSSIR